MSGGGLKYGAAAVVADPQVTIASIGDIAPRSYLCISSLHQAPIRVFQTLYDFPFAFEVFFVQDEEHEFELRGTCRLLNKYAEGRVTACARRAGLFETCRYTLLFNEASIVYIQICAFWQTNFIILLAL